ncbi:MAG: prepilin-type N-terminal cleavage/methylation domain-containing protein [Alphaproteobacteria bacterium]|nr:prepilin-type N-terminal cleavage/methylation domain-containing protein [Alphaproteobacteria bacterium]
MTRSSGFTLLEVLVALGLLVLVALLLGQGLRLGAVALQRGERTAERLEELRLTQDFLRRQLEAALPLPVPGERARLLLFAGTANSVTFIALPPAAIGRGLHVLRIEASEDALWLRWRPLGGAAPSLDLAGAERRLLAAGTGVGDFRFQGADGADATEWRLRGQLPTLVRLRFAGGRTDWPELVLAPRLKAADR